MDSTKKFNYSKEHFDSLSSMNNLEKNDPLEIKLTYKELLALRG